jgi:4-amino-4-deoxy-L-arabinose transferase-like glycosyltransferase
MKSTTKPGKHPLVSVLSERREALISGLVSMAIGLYAVSKYGLVRKYLAGAARSMSGSWGNWFYTAYDQDGFITVEKPPLALWVQATSVRVFGMNKWAILLPSVLMAAGTAYLTARILQRVAGRLEGLVGGLLMAVMPGMVAIGRSNMADVYVAYFAALAVYAAIGSLSDWRKSWLVGGSLGLAFLAKGAFAMYPGIAIICMLGWMKRDRVKFLALCGLSWLIVGFWWAVIIEFVDPARRPYVAHTRTNSALEQLFGWGGLGGARAPVDYPDGFGGRPGWARLLGEGGDQALWLLAMAVVGGLYYVYKTRESVGRGLVTGSLTWVLVFILTYSYTGRVVHEYYVASIAMPIVIAAVLGTVELWKRRKPVLVALGGVGSIGVALAYMNLAQPKLLGTATTIAVGAGAVVAAEAVRRGRGGVLLLGGALLAAGQVTWGVVGAAAVSETWNPVSRPGFYREAEEDVIPNSFYTTIRENRGSEKYLVAVPSYLYANEMVYRGEDPLVTGGFGGENQQALRLEQFKQMLGRGEVRYVINGGPHRYAEEIEGYLLDTCTKTRRAGSMNLWDCSVGAVAGTTTNGAGGWRG